MKKSLAVLNLVLSGSLVALAIPAHAALKTKTVDYELGQVKLEGYLAYDDSFSGKRPGILVVHEWTGLGDYAKKRADMLAQLGYVAFAADIYGKGVRPSPAEAGKVATIYKTDRQLMRARAQRGLDELLHHELTDSAKVAAIGYCFGGTTVLELARSGAPLTSIVSFHGGLDTPKAEDAKNIKGRVLAMTGGDDPNVPAAQVQAFENEMRAAKVDWQLISYGGAVHAFTNPAAGSDNSKGAAYNAKADQRSWKAMQDFFEETLGKR